MKAKWDKVDIGEEDQCWNWKGSIAANGYGRVSGKLAHRLIYQHNVGPIPEGLEVQHICNNRRCCNPKHLKLGTHKENMAFMAVTGSNKGEKHSGAKLTKADVLAIRKSAESVYVLAKRYSLHPDYVRLVIKRVTWKHVGDEN